MGWYHPWAEARDHRYLPATPQTVALYLGHLAAAGRSMASIELARAAISHFHAAAGMQKAPAPSQADVLTADVLNRVREVLRLPRRGRGGRSATTGGDAPATSGRGIAMWAKGRRVQRRSIPFSSFPLSLGLRPAAAAPGGGAGRTLIPEKN